VGRGAPDQWSACAGVGSTSLTGARVPEEGGVAAQMHNTVSKPDRARKEVHIMEAKVFVALDEEGEQETCR
jgi:hypothetical protein